MSEHLFEYEEDFSTGALVACCSCDWNHIQEGEPEPHSLKECVKLWQKHVRNVSKKTDVTTERLPP